MNWSEMDSIWLRGCSCSDGNHRDGRPQQGKGSNPDRFFFLWRNMSNRRAHMAILGAVLVEVDGGGVAQSVRACNVERCPFEPLTMQRGEPIAEPYALHVGVGWNGVVTCARVIACGETRPNRVVHEWSHVTCKRCLGARSGAHVSRKKGSTRSKKADSISKVPLIAQTDMFDGKEEA